MAARETAITETQPEIETVSYNLAAVLPNVPRSWIDEKLKSVDQTARPIIVPFELVEVQLASGAGGASIARISFSQALPENLKQHFFQRQRG